MRSLLITLDVTVALQDRGAAPSASARWPGLDHKATSRALQARSCGFCLD